MRIALVPLDSRPPSWQFPLRIAQIANAELVSPRRELLGTLHQSGDQPALLKWLVEAAADCDTAIISWDALIYGGLVQSRTEGNPLGVDEVADALRGIDWTRCAGYLWLTVPRLGMTIASAEQWAQHKLLAEYFTVWWQVKAGETGSSTAVRFDELITQLGAETIERAWALRHRNHESGKDALRLAAELGLRFCHVAVEDNARTGPHLGEVEALRKLSLELTGECRREGKPEPRYTFFDGTDEVGSLLTSRAVLDNRNAPPLPVRLTLFPSSPSPDQYFGLYESHSLEDGLLFLAKFLGFEYRAQADVQWLVCFGKQPQPDVFAQDPAEVFNNPLLLPQTFAEEEGHEDLFVADLQACNGGNPRLADKLAWLRGHDLYGLSAWNTNFNALGFSAAWLATFQVNSTPNYTALRRILFERLADDYIYQSIVRPEMKRRCSELALTELDLTHADSKTLLSLEAEATALGKAAIREHEVLFYNELNFSPERYTFSYTFPWKRLFEVEVHFDELPPSVNHLQSTRVH